MNLSPNSVEIIRQWLSTGFLGAILIVLMYGLKPLVEFFIRTRELRLQEKKDDRQGYGDLIDTLGEQVKTLGSEVRKLGSENGQLRDEVRELHGVLDGMRRQNLTDNISIQSRIIELMPKELVTPEVQHALNVLSGITMAIQAKPAAKRVRSSSARRRRPSQPA